MRKKLLSSVGLALFGAFQPWSDAHAIDYSETFVASNRLTINWCTDGSDVRFKLTGTGTGWLGVGFNTRQQMPNSDVIMVTGEGSFQDAFADFRGAPGKDASQNVTVDSATQQNGVTTVEFSRPIVSPDETDDLALDADLFMVWAMNRTSDSFTAQHTDRGFTTSRVNLSAAAACGGLAPTGDFSADGKLDVVDIDLLRDAIRAGTNVATFDVNGDAVVNTTDLPDYLRTAFNSYIGDSNLDQQFSTADLVQVFAAGEYEDTADQNSTWGEGDWNADAEFNTADLVFAFQDGGFEAGPRAAVAAVPEPACATAVLFMALGALRRARRR